MSNTKKWTISLAVIAGALILLFVVLSGRSAVLNGEFETIDQQSTGYADFSVVGYDAETYEEVLRSSFSDVYVASGHYDLGLELGAGSEVLLQICHTELRSDKGQSNESDCWTQPNSVIECPRSVTVQRQSGIAGLFGAKIVLTSGCTSDDVESIKESTGVEFVQPTHTADPPDDPEEQKDAEDPPQTQRPDGEEAEPETIYIDGTRLLQTVVEGDTVTNLTTVENIEHITNVTNITEDTLASLACAPGQVAKWTGSLWACANDNAGSGGSIQLLSLAANQLSISEGNSVDLSVYLDNTDLLASISCAANQLVKYIAGSWQCANDENTDQQTITLAGNTLSILNGGSVDLSSFMDNTDLLASTACVEGQVVKYISSAWVCADDNDDQDISLAANQLSISNGSSVDLSVYLDNTDLLASISCTANQVVKFISGSWQCANDNDTNTTYTAGTGITINGSNVISAVLGDSITTGELVDGAVTSAKIADGTIQFADIGVNGCTNGQIVKFNGAAWVCAADDNTITDTTYTAGEGLVLSSEEFALDLDSLPGVSSMAGNDYFAISTAAGNRKITYDEVFSDLLGALNYRGTWNADTNTPDLTAYCDAGTTKGHYFVVSDPGATDLDGNNNWLVQDWAVCGDGVWQRIQGTALITSVFGRTGTVTAQNGDYNAGQITNTPAGSISAVTVQGALNELDVEKLSTALMSGMIYVGDGSNTATAVAMSGDAVMANDGTVTITNGAVDSAKIADGTIQFADIADNGCTSGQIMKYDGSDWICATDDNSGVTYTAGDGLALTGSEFAVDAPTCTGMNKLLWDGTAFTCAADVDTNTTYTAGTGIAIDGSNVISATLGDSITSDEIVDGTIQTIDLADGSVTSAKIADGTIVAADIAPDALDFAQFVDSMTLDATTTITLGDNDFIANLTGTGEFQVQDNGTMVLSIAENGAFTQQVSVDTGNAFVVNNAGGDSLFTIDSSASLVYIGDPTADDTGVPLVLDRKNTAGDPTGTDGAMYYNTVANRFRCHEAGSWKNCIGGGSGTSDILTVTADVEGQPNIDEPRPNNGMTEIPELGIEVDPGVTMRAEYHLIIDQPAPAWGISINFPAYENGEMIAGRAQWLNGTNSNSATWRSYALTPSTPNFTRGVYDNSVGRTTDNVMTIEVTWRNDSSATKTWNIEFGNDIVFNNASAIPVIRNTGSSVLYTLK